MGSLNAIKKGESRCDFCGKDGTREIGATEMAKQLRSHFEFPPTSLEQRGSFWLLGRHIRLRDNGKIEQLLQVLYAAATRKRKANADAGHVDVAAFAHCVVAERFQSVWPARAEDWR